MDNPDTELLASWRDGMHIKNGRWGILIEDGDWDGAAQYDDTFAIYTRRQVVVSNTGKQVTLKPSVYNRESFVATGRLGQLLDSRPGDATWHGARCQQTGFDFSQLRDHF